MKKAKMREPSSGGHPDEPQATVHLREGVEIPVIVEQFEIMVDGNLGDQAILGTARRDALPPAARVQLARTGMRLSARKWFHHR
jgi:hypothetical protein